MAVRSPRRLTVCFARPLGCCCKFIALAVLGAVLGGSLQSAAQAQIVIGNHVGPAVSTPTGSVKATSSGTARAAFGPEAPAAVQAAAATTAGSAPAALEFKPGITELGTGPQPVLDAIVARLRADEKLRVQLVSHATDGSNDSVEARRISLARAIAIRRYLIDQGVSHLRIDVRALGNHSDHGPASDQVDLLVVSQ